MNKYKIIKQDGNKVEVYNTQSTRKFTGTLFSNGTKVALENWGGRSAVAPKIVTLS